jgi:hypothetical protein
MKRMQPVGLCSAALTLALALMATASWAQEVEPADQPDQAIHLIGVSAESSTALDGAFAGFATLSFAGTTFPVNTSSLPLALTAQPDNAGRIVGSSGHLFDFGNGDTLNTIDAVHLFGSGSGFFRVFETMTITGGTGRFQNASGEIEAYGVIQMDGLFVVAQWSLEGDLKS